jgi:hypothetical protein
VRTLVRYTKVAIVRPGDDGVPCLGPWVDPASPRTLDAMSLPEVLGRGQLHEGPPPVLPPRIAYGRLVDAWWWDSDDPDWSRGNGPRPACHALQEGV